MMDRIRDVQAAPVRTEKTVAWVRNGVEYMLHPVTSTISHPIYVTVPNFRAMGRSPIPQHSGLCSGEAPSHQLRGGPSTSHGLRCRRQPSYFVVRLVLSEKYEAHVPEHHPTVLRVHSYLAWAWSNGPTLELLDFFYKLYHRFQPETMHGNAG